MVIGVGDIAMRTRFRLGDDRASGVRMRVYQKIVALQSLKDGLRGLRHLPTRLSNT